MTITITLYTDYKSPYAFLAKDLAYILEDQRNIKIDWLPYTLDIPDYLGSAQVDENGTIIDSQRTDHQWRRVRYSYMDARRYANERGLTLRGPKKIWDSTLAALGLLWSKRSERSIFRVYHDILFEKFWKRELDIEDLTAIEAIMIKAGVQTDGFVEWTNTSGREEHDNIRITAEKSGIFGVPTFVIEGEQFWGREHLELIGLRLDALGFKVR